MRISQKEKLRILKIKKAGLCLFILGLLFLPGQNHYLTVLASERPSLIQESNFDLPIPAPYPINFTQKQPPFLTARSVMVLDRDSSVILYQKEAYFRLLPASTVKIMTALVALDQYSLDQVLIVSGISSEGQTIELQEGEQITVRALLYGLLVASANDTAEVLAKNYPGGEIAFVRKMNQKAIELNLFDTYFANPSGLDEDETGNLLLSHSFTTTADLAHLAIKALSNPVFSQIVATRQIFITDVGGKIVHPLENVNQLLGRVEGIKGVKTGWTQQAGECLVSLVERGEKGLVVVVLGSQDRFGETVQLVEWAFTNHEWERITLPIPER